MAIILLNGRLAGNRFYLTMYKKYLPTILWFNVNYRIKIFQVNSLKAFLYGFYNPVNVKKIK